MAGNEEICAVSTGTGQSTAVEHVQCGPMILSTTKENPAKPTQPMHDAFMEEIENIKIFLSDE